jgi:hypothetical protein
MDIWLVLLDAVLIVFMQYEAFFNTMTCFAWKEGIHVALHVLFWLWYYCSSLTYLLSRMLVLNTRISPSYEVAFGFHNCVYAVRRIRPSAFQVRIITPHGIWLQECQMRWSLNHWVSQAVQQSVVTWVTLRWGSSSQKKKKCQVQTTSQEDQALNLRLRTQSVTEVRALCE